MKGSNEYIYDGEGFFPKDGKKISKTLRSLIMAISLCISLTIFIIEIYSIDGFGIMWKATISWIAAIIIMGYVFYTLAYAWHFKGEKGGNLLPQCYENNKGLKEELEQNKKLNKNNCVIDEIK